MGKIKDAKKYLNDYLKYYNNDEFSDIDYVKNKFKQDYNNNIIKFLNETNLKTDILSNGLLNTLRTRLYNGVSPYSYDHLLKRIYDAIELSGNRGWSKRDDIWAEYLQIPKNKRNNWIDAPNVINSKYKPNKGNKNINYKTLDYYDPKYIKKLLFDAGILNTKNGIDRNYGTQNYLDYNQNKLSSAISDYFGPHTIGRGYDEKGDYISFYDKWDLSPIGNPGKHIEINNSNLEDQSLGIGKPIEFYDRIYLDDYFNIPENKRGGHYIPEITVKPSKNMAIGGNKYINEPLFKLTSFGLTPNIVKGGYQNPVGDGIFRMHATKKGTDNIFIGKDLAVDNNELVRENNGYVEVLSDDLKLPNKQSPVGIYQGLVNGGLRPAIAFNNAFRIQEDYKNAKGINNNQEYAKLGIKERIRQAGQSFGNWINPIEIMEYNDGISAETLLRNRLKQEENNKYNPLSGYNFITKKWKSHKSPEGGKDTIGYGFKLGIDNELDKLYEDQGYLTDEQVENKLTQNVIKYLNNAKEYYNSQGGDFDKLNPMYQSVLGDIHYTAGLSKFPKLIEAIKNNDFENIKKEVGRGYHDENGEFHVLENRNRRLRQELDSYNKYVTSKIKQRFGGKTHMNQYRDRIDNGLLFTINPIPTGNQNIATFKNGGRVKADLGTATMWSNMGLGLVNSLVQGIAGSYIGKKTRDMYNSLKRTSTYVPTAREHIVYSDESNAKRDAARRAAAANERIVDVNTNSSKVAANRRMINNLNQNQQLSEIENYEIGRRDAARNAEAQLQTQYNLEDTKNKINDIREANDFEAQKQIGLVNARANAANTWGQAIASGLSTIGGAISDRVSQLYTLAGSQNKEVAQTAIEKLGLDIQGVANNKASKAFVAEYNQKNPNGQINLGTGDRIMTDYQGNQYIYNKWTGKRIKLKGLSLANPFTDTTLTNSAIPS